MIEKDHFLVGFNFFFVHAGLEMMFNLQANLFFVVFFCNEFYTTSTAIIIIVILCSTIVKTNWGSYIIENVQSSLLLPAPSGRGLIKWAQSSKFFAHAPSSPSTLISAPTTYSTFRRLCSTVPLKAHSKKNLFMLIFRSKNSPNSPCTVVCTFQIERILLKFDGLVYSANYAKSQSPSKNSFWTKMKKSCNCLEWCRAASVWMYPTKNEVQIVLTWPLPHGEW